MGNGNSKNVDNDSSAAESVNWLHTEQNNNKVNSDGLEEISLDINFSEEMSSSDNIDHLFNTLDKAVTANKEGVNNDNNTSPFISTDLYNKIMNGGSEESPFINSEIYEKIMQGGNRRVNSDNLSESSSAILKALSNVTITTSDIQSNNKYGFSTTSSDNFQQVENILSNTSIESLKSPNSTYNVDDINNSSSEGTPYRMSSSSINTSDINVVSVDSRNGRRYL